jgi:hypothetical protein
VGVGCRFSDYNESAAEEQHGQKLISNNKDDDSAVVKPGSSMTVYLAKTNVIYQVRVRVKKPLNDNENLHVTKFKLAFLQADAAGHQRMMYVTKTSISSKVCKTAL